MDLQKINHILNSYPTGLILHNELPFHFIFRLPNIRKINLELICQIFQILSLHFSIDAIDHRSAAAWNEAYEDLPYCVKGDCVLHMAARMDWCEMIDLLIALKANIYLQNSMDGNSPLHIALLNGNTAAARKLISKGACLDYPRNKDSLTPFNVFTKIYGNEQVLMSWFEL